MGDDAQLAQLSACLQQSLSPDPAVRTQAEQFLKDGSVQPGFPMLLMRLLASEGSDAAVRQGAAVTFKNLVKNNWVEKEADVVGAPAPYSVAAGEKEQVRAMLVGLMLGAPRLVQAQLSEALSIVSAADFPDRWPGLLPELIQRMGTPGARDFNAVVGVLTTANTIFKRYRQAYKSDELYKELKYVLDTFAGPLLVLLKEASAAIDSNAGNLELLVNLFKCLRLICRVFYSLNSQELPEVFEDNMDAWMGEFHKFLCYDNPQLAAVDNKDREKAGAVDQVKAAICDNVNLYIEKNEEEFQRFLQTFVQDVWTLLTKTGLEPNKDHLVTSGVRFLTTVANSVHHQLFAGGDTLRQVCESIVIPNLQFREDDEELFESNHVEYIRRDIEGSDSDTRRRGACELVKGLTAKFPEVMTQSVSGYVTALLGQYAADPHNAWKAKDAAVYLVISLVGKSKSVVKGATETNDLVSVTDFFTQQIAPDLARAASGDAAGGTGRHVLYADALKFLTIFRSQIPTQMAVQALPAVVTLLASRENVVHTYAANALERTLTVRDHPPVGSPPGTRSTLRYTPGDIQPYAQQMLQNLFNVFAMPDSSENEYAMKATMRLISFMGDSIKPIAGVCLERLSGMVMETCKNPRNPTFSHYLFESVAALVKAGAGDPGLIATFERLLFPPFQHVLQQDVVEFAPYVFQLLSQMIESHPGALPGSYMGIFPALLVPMLWDRSANVTPLVRLLEAYLRKAPNEVHGAGHIQGILGVFQKLVSSRAQDHHGFFILNAFVEALPLPAWADKLPAIWGILFQRLQSSKTTKFSKCFVVFISLLAAKHGVVAVTESMAKVQPGIFEMVLTGVVTEAIANISGTVEEKVVAVAAAKFLTECPAVLAQDASWAKLLTAVVTMMERPAEHKGEEDLDAEAEEAEARAGYSAAYNALRQAARTETDPVPAVTDPKVNLAIALAAVSATQPGRIGSIVAGQCAPEVQQAIAGYCAQGGVAIQ